MSIGRVPGATGIQPSIVDAKGDLIVATAADSVDRLAVGSANQVLTVDSSTATGLKWAAVSAASYKGCHIYNDAAITLSNTTSTKLTYNSEVLDTDSFHSTSTNTGRITIPAGLGGKYLFYAYVSYASNATGFRVLDFQKNGGDYYAESYVAAVNGQRTSIYISQVFSLNATDYIEVEGYQNSGGNLATRAFEIGNYFGCIYLGA